MAEAEKVIIDNLSLKQLLNPELVKELPSEVFPTAIIFVSESEKNGKIESCPIIISHQNSQEVKCKKIHLESPNTSLLKEFTKIIEKRKGL
jgi:hypothetical protein